MAVSMDTVNLKGVTDGHFVVVKGKQTGIVAQKLKTKILVVFNKILEKFHWTLLNQDKLVIVNLYFFPDDVLLCYIKKNI